jgi:hypothetical protein
MSIEKEIIEVARQMRQEQRLYLTTRSRSSLKVITNKEKLFDRILDEYDRIKQTSPLNGGY